MVAIYEPETLTKIGTFDGDLEATIKNFSPDFCLVTYGLENNNKYALYKEFPESHLVMISQKKQKSKNSIGNILHNTTLTITSDSNKLNQKIYQEFREKTSMSLLDAPEEYARFMKIIGIAFQILREKGPAAMISLQKPL